MVVDVGETLGEPEPIKVPPQLPVYQSTVSPLPTVADKVEEAPYAIVGGVAVGLVGSDGVAFTVTVTCTHVDTQPVPVFLVRAK